MNPHTFMVEKPCPVCLKNTRVIKTRSRIPVERTDEDHCIHYKGFNPYYYTVWICEHCGFAADEKNFLKRLPDRDRKKIWEYLSRKQFDIEFNEERDLPDAVASYRLALSYLDMMKAPLSRKAAFNLQLAWIYRLSGEEGEFAEEEREYMEKAAELYDLSISTERYPSGNLTDSGALYLVGAIYYRLGDLEKCAQHLSRLIGDNTLKSREPKVYDEARDLWGDVRALQAKQNKAAEKNAQANVRKSVGLKTPAQGSPRRR